MVKNVITREQAQEQLDILNEYYDVDRNFLIEELQKPLENHSLGILKALVRGRLSIELEGEGIVITQLLSKAIGERRTITYGELNYEAVKAADKAKTFEKPFISLAVMGNVPSGIFKGMTRADYKTAEDLGNYFLLV